MSENKISKAPEPISPLRGGGYIPKPNKSERLPRWNKWRLMPEVKEWEAVALSLNIEPGEIKTDGNAWMGAAHPFSEGEEFNDRLTILNKHVSNRTHFPTPCILNMANWYQCEVRLDEFAEWCAHVGFAIPSELSALAKLATQTAQKVEVAPAAEGKKEFWADRAKFREQNEEAKAKAGRYQLYEAAQFIADSSSAVTERSKVAQLVNSTLLGKSCIR